MDLDSAQRALLEEVVELVSARPPTPPAEGEFRVRHADQRRAIDDLVSRQHLVPVSGYYLPTVAGLRALATPSALELIRRCNSFIDLLKEKIRARPEKGTWGPQTLAAGSAFDESDAQLLLTMILVGGARISTGWAYVPGLPWVASFNVRLDGVLDAEHFEEREPEVTEARGPWCLSRVYAHNFRTFVNFEWRLPQACVLVGDNGAGKSAFVELLWLLKALLVRGQRVDETPAAGARTSWLKEPEQTLEIEVRRGTDSFIYRLGIIHDETIALSEELRGPDGVLYRSRAGVVELFGDRPSAAPRTTIDFDRRRSFVAAIEPRHDNRRIVEFREFITSIQAIKPDVERLIGEAGDESRELRSDLTNFPSWFRARAPEDPIALGDLTRDLQRALAGFEVLRLQPVSSKAKALVVEFRFGKGSYTLDWSQLSDGQRLLIALYGWLRLGLPSASLVSIDEAENYLSPTEIQPWFIAVADTAAARSQQLLVVSHHPESINYLAADSAWRMWREPLSGHTRIEQLEPDRDTGLTAYEALKDHLAEPQGTHES